MEKILSNIIRTESSKFGFEYETIAAFISVESGGKGFNADGKIIIQFEPSWFRRKQPYAPTGLWSVNKVERQSDEWLAFNSAFKISPEYAMQSTSIGLGQIMGFHYPRLGYHSVGEMWDDAKKGLDRQVWQICKFIETDIKLQSCLKAHDWDGIATLYNGSGYKALAKKIGREPYDISLQKAYNSLKNKSL